ncbi:hypothetical protein ABZ619_10240 [Streptomyces sp. NPDC007851]|uniref:hypothetical protein n=1 Tax=Streptomyces sp. NPDC007851 TaxID=3155008 RepID=UPI0033E9AD5E
MNKLAKRIAVAVSSVAVAGVAVVGAGGTASAATPAPVHVQRSAEVNADYRDHVAGSLWHSRDGRRDHRDDEGWKSERSYRHDWNRYESDDRGWDHHDWNHGDR